MTAAFLLQQTKFLKFRKQIHRFFLRESQIFLNFSDLVDNEYSVFFIKPGILP